MWRWKQAPGKNAGERAALVRDGSAVERHAAVDRYATDSISYYALYPGWQYFQAPGLAGFIAYERHLGVALTCGGPISSPNERAGLIAAFEAYCRVEGLRPAFVGTSRVEAEGCAARGWKALKLGEEPILDAATYAPRGNRAKKVRSAQNQARKNGVTVEVIPPGVRPASPLLADVVAIREAWAKARKVSPLGFTLRLQPLRGIEDKILLLARHQGQPVAFLTCVPAPGRAAYAVEDLCRTPSAPNGASEMLISTALDECRARGATTLNLGLAPLRGCRRQALGSRLAGLSLAAIRRLGSPFYQFRALEHFKSKFAPSAWEETYLVYRPGHLTRTLTALTLAFTPGHFGALHTAMSRFQRGRARVASRVAAVSAAAALVAIAYLSPQTLGRAGSRAELLAVPATGVAHEAGRHLVIDAAIGAVAAGWYVNSTRRS